MSVHCPQLKARCSSITEYSCHVMQQDHYLASSHWFISTCTKLSHFIAAPLPPPPPPPPPPKKKKKTCFFFLAKHDCALGG